MGVTSRVYSHGLESGTTNQFIYFDRRPGKRETGQRNEQRQRASEVRLGTFDSPFPTSLPLPSPFPFSSFLFSPRTRPIRSEIFSPTTVLNGVSLFEWLIQTPTLCSGTEKSLSSPSISMQSPIRITLSNQPRPQLLYPPSVVYLSNISRMFSPSCPSVTLL